MATIAELRGGDRDHPPELPRTENPDRRSRRQWRHSGRSATDSVCAARHAASRAPSASSAVARIAAASRSEEHTSELQSLMRISYAVFCLKKKKQHSTTRT